MEIYPAGDQELYIADPLLNQPTISLLYKCDDLHISRELKMFCEQNASLKYCCSS